MVFFQLCFWRPDLQEHGHIIDLCRDEQNLVEQRSYVTKVVYGDTFWVDDGTKEIKVRFTGIDAPDTDVQERDSFKRLLAYVYLEDGTFLNAHLVESGYPVVDTHPPNVKYVDLFLKLQQDAKIAVLGSRRVYLYPEYRHGSRGCVFR